VVPPAPGTASLGAIGAHTKIPNLRVLAKSLPPVNGSYLKTATMRAPGDPQAAFPFEQLLDELAYAAKIDPYQFRVQNITTANDPAAPWYFTDRWLGVLEAAAKAANWQPRVAASNLSSATVVTGRGIAASPHSNALAAVVAEIEVNKQTGKIIAKQVYAAQDSGLSINPALVENQIIGTVVMSVSRVLLEQVQFDTRRVTSLDWTSYPIVRFKDSPKVTPIVVQRLDKASQGSGEIPTPATIAAVANAFFDATGVRLREAPMTPGRVRAALKAAGVA
jgi:nicotinate dehydrogenase subunit B